MRLFKINFMTVENKILFEYHHTFLYLKTCSGTKQNNSNYFLSNT